MKKIGIYPGSFDPFTKGHESILANALNLFDEIVIAIGVNETKKSYFSLESRLKHIESIYEKQKKVKIISYSELTVAICEKYQANYIIRGLRSNKDFDYELPIAQTNKHLAPAIETVFFTSDLALNFIQSTIIRELHKNGTDLAAFVTNSDILVNY